MPVPPAQSAAENPARPALEAALSGLSIALLLAVVYRGTFEWMTDRFSQPGSYFTHGYLVPFVAAGLAWRRRRSLSWGADPSPLAGGGLLLLGLGLHAAALVVRVHFLSGLSLLPTLAGLAWLLGGRTAARRLAPAILFLLFMVPAPLWAMAHLSLSLKLFTTEVAVRTAIVMGIEATRKGAAIQLAGDGGTLLVGDICGGLRYLVALGAFGALTALLSTAGPLARALVFAASLPAALAANAARVLFLVVVASRYGADAAAGAVHDLSGGIVFLVAVGLLVVLERSFRK